MKKKVGILLVLILLVSVFTIGCGGNEALTDWDYIEDKGELIIGITLYEPMNYNDENGQLTGFDTEFAQAACALLGVEPKFQVIDWEQKETELKSKTIDAIWNGLTVTEGRRQDMAFSTSYLVNKQVVVIKKDNAEKYATLEGMAGASVTAENGSAGQDAVEANEVLSANDFVASAAQKDVLMEIKAGTTEIGVLDFVMARSVIRDDTDYSDLVINESIELAPEEYAIGFRIGDDETVAKFNQAIEDLIADGTLLALAEKYGLSDVLAVN
ncbi:MAG: transporter substrate-binding domain-containing protein [Anaerovoracaceae bacterium]